MGVDQVADPAPTARQVVQRAQEVGVLPRDHRVKLHQFARAIVDQLLPRLNREKDRAPADERLVIALESREQGQDVLQLLLFAPSPFEQRGQTFRDQSSPHSHPKEAGEQFDSATRIVATKDICFFSIH